MMYSFDGDQPIVVSLSSSLFAVVVLVFVLVPYRLWWGKLSVYGPI